MAFENNVVEDFSKVFKKNNGWCEKYNCQCSVGNDPPRFYPNYPCFKGLAGWVLESSTGCGNWKDSGD